MKCTIRYPALVTGSATYARAPVKAVVMQTDEVTIVEVDGSDAPLAFTVHLERGVKSKQQADTETREIRLVDNHLFVRSQSGDSSALTQDKILTPHGLGFRMGQEIAAAISKLAMQKVGHQEVLAAKSALEKNFMAKASAIVAIQQATEGFTIDESGLVELEEWRQRMLREADLLVVIGGELWERCDEPVYRVNVRGTPEIIAEVETSLSRGTRHDRLSDLAAYTRVFNALEYDLALHALHAADSYTKPHAISSNDRIEVHVPEAVRFNSAEFGLDSIARTLVMDVARQMADGVAKKGATWMSGYPSQVIFRWTLLRDELAKYTLFASHIPDELEDLLSDLAKALKRVPSHQDIPLALRVQGDDIRHCLNRWEDRPLERPPTQTMRMSEGYGSRDGAPYRF